MNFGETIKKGLYALKRNRIAEGIVAIVVVGGGVFLRPRLCDSGIFLKKELFIWKPRF